MNRADLSGACMKSRNPSRVSYGLLRKLHLVVLATSIGVVIYCFVGDQAMLAALPDVQYVSAHGSDLNSGLSWNTPKATIPAAEKSCPASGTCTINVASLRLSASAVVYRSDTTIRCVPGAILSTAVTNGAPITLKASNIQITGCTFAYSSGIGNTVVAIPSSASHITIDHDAFRGYAGRPSYAGIIHVGNRTNKSPATAITDVVVTDNRFVDVDPIAINLQDDVSRVMISHNDIATDVSESNSPTINGQTSDAGTELDTITIANNSISKGTRNNCIQIQNLAKQGAGARGDLSGVFNHTTIQNVTVSDNTCRLQAHAGAGAGASGYSMVGITKLMESGNVFEGNGQFITGNAPFEVVSSQDVNSSHNVARLGTIDRTTTAFTVIGERFAPARNVSLTENSVVMAVDGTAPGSCYHVAAGPTARVEQITLTGNSCNLSGSTTTGTLRGIWIQSFGRDALMRGGVLSGNVITGARRAEVLGIHIEQNAGTIAGWRVGRNQFSKTRRDIVGK